MAIFIYLVTRKDKFYDLKIPAESQEEADAIAAEMKGRRQMQIEFCGCEADWEDFGPVKVDPSAYIKVHETKPCGMACWWFDISPKGASHPRFWSAAPGSTYQEAVQQVIVRAKYSGCHIARLLS